MADRPAYGTPGDDSTRHEHIPLDGTADPGVPVDLDIGIESGRVTLVLDGPAGTVGTAGGTRGVDVSVRHEPGAHAPWARGMAGMLNWVGEQVGEQLGYELRGSPAEAVAATRIERAGDRVVVRASPHLPLRHIPLDVTVHAPEGARLRLHGGSAPLTVDGTLGSADIVTGSGDVSLGRLVAGGSVRTGSGDVTLESAGGTVELRTGSGAVLASSLTTPATVATGSGAVRVGRLDGDVLLRSGSGDLTVGDAGSGEVEIHTGSGDIRAGVRRGCVAEVDLSSGTGTVSSDLEVSATEPTGDVPLRIRARARAGSVSVGAAPAR
ncbi:DUF4097 family beta strand repeat protein [Haloechinothrix sp. YIM 98757]|uniref:DUF4097 family beta strand repeat protein n=1 Tax=Haloechinothrix aidingensis TaxID=2752311 RepID=A0A838A9E6_9PSEU|nr:DUF4097 family beta strand repeat-containing protein [Haloechinothrix aidingensis]MBA0126158.1 DUF4097 family beta strand repeat protein [Haloechinothrix aidingensis]